MLDILYSPIPFLELTPFLPYSPGIISSKSNEFLSCLEEKYLESTDFDLAILLSSPGFIPFCLMSLYSSY